MIWHFMQFVFIVYICISINDICISNTDIWGCKNTDILNLNRDIGIWNTDICNKMRISVGLAHRITISVILILLNNQI